MSDAPNTAEVLSAVFTLDEQIAKLNADRQALLDALYKAGDKGPWQTSRGVLRLAKAGPGPGKKGAPSRVVLRAPKTPPAPVTVEV